MTNYKDENMVAKPYINSCKKCGKSFVASTTKLPYCQDCKAKPKKYPYAYKKARIDAQIRDKCVCTLCHKNLEKGFNVAFLDGNENNISLDNLATVCNKCLKHVHNEGNKAIICVKIKENAEELREQQEREKNAEKHDLTNLHKLLKKLER